MSALPFEELSDNPSINEDESEPSISGGNLWIYNKECLTYDVIVDLRALG